MNKIFNHQNLKKYQKTMRNRIDTDPEKITERENQAKVFPQNTRIETKSPGKTGISC